MTLFQNPSTSWPVGADRRSTAERRRGGSDGPKAEGMLSSLRGVPWVIAVFMLVLILPVETSFTVGSFRLTFYRLFLIVSFVPCLSRVFSGKCGGVHPCDLLMVGYVGWAALALAVHHGTGVALESGGIYIIEALGSYLVARAYIRTERQFRGFVALLTLLVIGFALVTVPEALTGRHFLRSVSGGPNPRLGLDRAFGSFEHPILYGVFCASALSLAWYTLSSGNKVTWPRARRAVLICLSATMSVSGGPLAGMMVQTMLIGWDVITRAFRKRWRLLLGILVVGWIVVDLLSNRGPLKVIITYLTFSPTTAYNRLIIWEWGFHHNVLVHPIFGIGLNEWTRPSWMHSTSMDAFWLVVMVMYGLPAFLFLASAILYLLMKVGRVALRGGTTGQFAHGWLVMMAGMIVAATTVHFWNALFVHFYLLVGSGVWMVSAANYSGAKQGQGRGLHVLGGVSGSCATSKAHAPIR